MRILTSLIMLGFVAGCALLPVNRIEVSPELTKNPVRTVFIFEPGFPKKVERKWPTDWLEMKPENQAATAQYLLTVFKDAISSRLQVESSYVSDEQFKAWAKKITANLAKGRVPIRLDPIDIPVESVLLIGVVGYGRQMTQFHFVFLPILPGSKHHVVGKMKWDHTCDVQAILVNPRTGKILFDVRHQLFINVDREDPDLLKQVTLEVAKVIADVFPK